MFIGEKGRLLLPHFMQLPKLIVDGKYKEIDPAQIDKFNLGTPIRNYSSEGPKHYHQFIDACLGEDTTTAPFSYASRLTETILLGTIQIRSYIGIVRMPNLRRKKPINTWMGNTGNFRLHLHVYACASARLHMHKLHLISDIHLVNAYLVIQI